MRLPLGQAIIWFVLLLSAAAILCCSGQESRDGKLSSLSQPQSLSAERDEVVQPALALGVNSDPWKPAPYPEAASAICITGTLQCEDFESGTLDLWRQASPEDLSLLAGAGSRSSTALAVGDGGQPSYVFQEDLARSREATLAFSFDPHGAIVATDGDRPFDAVRIASVTGPNGVLVGLRVRKGEDQSYRAYLEWSDEKGNLQLDNQSGAFPLVDGWQKVTVGYYAGHWIAAWVNDNPVRRIDVSHADQYGTNIAVGRLTSAEGVKLHGTILFDDVVFGVSGAKDLWVDAETGDDAGHSGLGPEEAFRTIQRAADLAGPGTTIHIMPGVYRESVVPAMGGNAAEPILYLAEKGPGTVSVRGSVPASSLAWIQVTSGNIGLPAGVDASNIYYTDLSTWGLEGPPRFIVELDGAGNVVDRLSPAREPDWLVREEWKVHELWWFANGGWAVAGCDPTTDQDHHCDYPWRSFTKLTDTTNDADPAGIEPGNLTTLGNLTGATVVAMDAQHAHYVYRRTIVAHDVTAGRIVVDEDCDHDGEPGIGWGSKYYVENHPALADRPGEWWFDLKSQRLYLWSPTGGNPATLNLEISRLEDGFDLGNRSFVSLDGLTIELFNGDAYRISHQNAWQKAHGNTLSNVTLRYAGRGVLLYQYVSEAPELYAIDGFVLEGSEIAFMDTVGFYASMWWTDAPDPVHFSHSGVRNSVLRNNEFHHLGYDSDHRSGVGVRVFFPDRLLFEGNYVHHVAQNGAHFHLSLADSAKEYGFSPQEIKLGEILIKDNIFEKACQLSSDCGALKFGGNWRPYTHVFRDVLVTGNVFRDTFGWSYVSIRRGVNEIGDGNGFYLDNASGIHAYRNIAYNNTGSGFKLTCLWRDGDIVFFNNIAANNYSEGFKFTGSSSCDDHNGSVNTQLVNNILINNEAHGIDFTSAYDDDTFGNLTIDHNLYYNNGWNEEAAWNPADIQLFQGSRPTQYFHGLSEIRAGTPWEDHGVEGDPGFFDYSLADHDRYDGSWPDFHITTDTSVLDRGTAELPASLQSLLTLFGVPDVAFGGAYDIGRYEAPGVLGRPPARRTLPGGSAVFMLTSFPPDFPDALALSISSALPDLALELESPLLEPGGVVGLVVTDTHEPGEPLVPGLWYTVGLGATYGPLTQYTDLRVLVGGSEIWLPLVLK